MSPLDTPSQDWTIGLIGYGEVGRILAEDLRARGVTRLLASDINAMSPLDTPSQDWTIGLIGYGEVGRILAEDLRARGVTRLLASDINAMSPLDTPSQDWTIGLIGYGEVGRILAEDLRARGVTRLLASDIKLGGPSARPLVEHADRHGVELIAAPSGLAAEADLVISAVTASQAVAVAVAEACAPGLRAGTWYLDVNSASPGAKARAAALVGAAGGLFVEGAVMTSVPPYRIKVPLLLGGPVAAGLAPALNGIGFAATVADERLGVASATKMCRSVMIKGLEAMVIESFTAARAYGVEDAVIASLEETFPGIDWEQLGAYFFQRVILHGRRRAEEMREVAQTVREVGLEPWSAAGTAERQGWGADLAEQGAFGLREGAGFASAGDWRVEADRILARRA